MSGSCLLPNVGMGIGALGVISRLGSFSATMICIKDTHMS